MTAEDPIEALARRVYRLEQERVRGQAVTVTAVDPVTSTFTAELTDGQAVGGIGAPLSFLPSVDDVVQVDLHGASPVYQPSRVTDQDTVGFKDLAVTGDPLIMGQAFSEHLAPKTQFHGGGSVGGLTDPCLTPAGGGKAALFEATFECQPGHQYLLIMSNMWVRGNTGCTRIDANVWYEVSGTVGTDPPSVSVASNVFIRWPMNFNAGSIGHGVLMQKFFGYDVYAHFRFLVGLESFGGTAYIEMGSETHFNATLGTNVEPESVQLMVIDVSKVEWTNRAATNTGAGTPAAVKRFTHTYLANWTRRFRGDGTVHSDSANMAQGVDPNAVGQGDQASQVGDFKLNGTGASIATDLSGATVEKLEAWLYPAEWGNADGGTGYLRYHTNTSPGTLSGSAGLITVPGWKASQGRWVDISAWTSVFQAGTAKGLQVGQAGSSVRDRFGRFRGHLKAEPPAIRATFTR